jgi:aspartate kinase
MSNSDKKIKVLKFGGTSVKNPQRLAHAAEIVASECRSYKTVVVVSAMGNTTDNLVRLAGRCSERPNPRELDVLLASGEQQTIALLSIVLSDLGIKAKSFSGGQLGIVTESNYGNAEILSIDATKIYDAFASNDVIVVAGFQGVTSSGDITTLGRGGSDTSAVAIAAAVGAESCEIYTDVDGIFTADPNIINGAIQHRHIGYDECLEMAAKGAQVIHPRAVECARENSVLLLVRSVFNPGNTGTVIGPSDPLAEDSIVGITATDGFSLLTVEFEGASVDLTPVQSAVAKAVGAVNLVETFWRAANFVSSSHVVSGLNRASGQELVAEIGRIVGVRKASITFGLTRVSLVGSSIPSEVNSASPLRSSIHSLLEHDLQVVVGDLSASFYVDAENARQIWNSLHEELKPRFTGVQSISAQELCRTRQA